MFKELLLRKLIESKLGNMPKEERERLIRIVTEHPALFQKIAMKIKQQTDSGKDQQAATLSVMREYEGQIRKIMATGGE